MSSKAFWVVCKATTSTWFLVRSVGAHEHKQATDGHLLTGAMKCLDLFAGQKNLTDQEIPAFVNLAFPEIMKMFSEREKYPDVLRMRCVRILYSVIHWFETMKDVHTKAINDILSKVLPHWFDFLT
jgi:hypothetical protein